MGIGEFSIATYIIVGIFLSFYWYNKEYADDYKSMVEDGVEVEKGMVSILLLCLAIFWPFKLIKNLIFKRRI